MKYVLLGACLFAAFASQVSGQSAPEDVHRDARGPTTMCGLTGSNALDLIRQVTASPNLRRISGTDRFEYYLSADEMDAWVFTRPTESAHPAITCRHLFYDEAGNLYQDRNLRCDASRESCDRLFLEFQALDNAVRQGFERSQAE